MPNYNKTMHDPADPRRFPERPFLAVSAAVVRGEHILVVRRARPPALGLFTFPGGGVDSGEALLDAVTREVREETALTIAPLSLAGHREMIRHESDGRVGTHFVILCFAARWIAGEPVLNEELAEARWVSLDAIEALPTTDGLAEIAQAAFVLARA
jgi:ADP-ribose pyrophosphatase YjhB (NUDIX family)